MVHHVFTYGSLMFPQVWERVVSGQYQSIAATLPDHARFCVKQCSYPGMVKAKGSEVPGKLYLDVSAIDMAALDYFEGSDYQRLTVEVSIGGGGNSTPTHYHAQAYLFLPLERLTQFCWEPDAFTVENFLKVYCPD